MTRRFGYVDSSIGFELVQSCACVGSQTSISRYVILEYKGSLIEQDELFDSTSLNNMLGHRAPMLSISLYTLARQMSIVCSSSKYRYQRAGLR